jgi:hypothetical protein
VRVAAGWGVLPRDGPGCVLGCGCTACDGGVRAALTPGLYGMRTRHKAWGYVNFHLKPHGVNVERIRRDRILHEALTGRPDSLHLSLMFGISERPASQYARIARDLLAEPPDPGEGTAQVRPTPAHWGGSTESPRC